MGWHETSKTAHAHSPPPPPPPQYQANLAARAKHPDTPSAFMESELELDAAVRRFRAVASFPELYTCLASTAAPSLLASLLAHDNTDVAGAVLEVVQELTDDEPAGDDPDGAAALVSALADTGALDAVVARIAALDESIAEEAESIYVGLAALQNVVEIDVAPRATSLARGPLLPWLLVRVTIKAPFSPVTGAASETLALLTQTSPDAADALVAGGGVDALLRGVGAYRTADAATPDEKEHVANLFAALAAVLLTPAGRAAFVDAEGVDLMLLLLKRRRAAGGGALKTLDYALTRCPAAAAALVARGGLGPIFAAFMATSRAARRSRSDDADADGRAVSIVASLLDGLTAAADGGGAVVGATPPPPPPPEAAALLRRVQAKFVEADHEKVDRLLELYARFDGAAVTAAARVSAAAAAGDADAGDPSLAAAQVADAGGAAAEAAALVAAHAWASGDAGVRARIVAGLHARRTPLASLRGRVAARRDAAAEGDDAAAAAVDKARLDRLIVGMGGGGGEEEGGDRPAKRVRADE